jgi:hypothetical protein
LTIRASFLLALVVVGAGVWQVVRRRRLGLSAPDVWLVAYGLVMVASAGGAYSRGRSLQVVVATGLLIGLAMVMERTLQRFALAKLYRYLIAATAVACAFGVYQFFGDSFGLPTAWTGLKDIYTKHVFGFPRVQSVGLEPLFFASFLLLPLTLLVARLYTRAASWKVYGLLGLVVMVFALTLSRGGIYGGLGSLAVLAVWLWRAGTVRRLGLIALTIGLGAGAALGLIALTSRADHGSQPAAVHAYVAQTTHLTSNAGSADNDRSVNRKLAWRAFKEHPILGVGIGNFGYYAQAHDPRYAANPGVVVNNEYLEILAETGLVGLVALLGFVVALVLRVGRAWGRLEGEQRVWTVAVFAMLVGAAVQFYAFSTLYIIHIWFAIGLLLGLTAVAGKRDVKTS